MLKKKTFLRALIREDLNDEKDFIEEVLSNNWAKKGSGVEGHFQPKRTTWAKAECAVGMT